MAEVRLPLFQRNPIAALLQAAKGPPSKWLRNLR
jgi:hypothetical protein